MAAPTSEVQFTVDKLLRSVLHKLSIESERLVLHRRSKDSKSDDLYLPKSEKLHFKAEIVAAIRIALLEESVHSAVPIRDVTTTDITGLSIYLHRPRIFENTILKVLREQREYGTAKQSDVEHKNVVLYTGLSPERSDTDRNTSVSVDILRSYLLVLHMRLLLESHGHNVTCVSTADEMSHVCRHLGLKVIPCDKISCDSSEIAATVSKARTHSCQCSMTSPTKTHGTAQSPAETAGTAVPMSHNDQLNCVETSEDCAIDLQKYITATGLQQGRLHFDKNIHLAEVTVHGQPSPVIERVAAIDKYLHSVGIVTCVHVVHQRQAFNQQKLQLMLQALAHPDRNMEQFQFVYGAITARKSTGSGDQLTADSYYRCRYNQMKQASVMKYGHTVHGDGWDDVISNLTDACIKFDLLSSVARNGVRVDMGETHEDGTASQRNTGDGAFVMYNCARLASLFSQFQQHVHTGLYPELPSPSQVDFSLLKEEEEWWLVYNYVSMYPEIVEQAVQPFNGHDTIHAKILTHKICHFLSSLSRCISSYYSRVHVLGENRPYLLPTMFARLYLLHSVHHVLVNGLALLGIAAPTQL